METEPANPRPTDAAKVPPTEPAQTGSVNPARLSGPQVLMLALTAAVVTANAYYIHPIVARVAADFGVGPALIGIVPAANQVALALGIFLLLPLGDRIDNRRLTLIFVIGQIAALATMALAQEFWLFAAGSTVLGFFTIAPYILPAYASKRVPSAKLGQVTAVLTTGIIAGILVARTGSGVIGEHVGWRSVYLIAVVLMTLVAICLPLTMDRDPPPTVEGGSRKSYPALLASILPLIREHPSILVSGAIQGLSFGIFLSVWLGLGLHLTSPEMGYGVDTVGYLSAIAAINLLATPRLGAWADRVGARRARSILAGIQWAGVLLLWPLGQNLWVLILPLLVMNTAGPAVDVTNRMTFLDQSPDRRTRLMTVYIVMMFVGGGLSSWAGTAVYDLAGWTGNALLALAQSSLVFLLAWRSGRAEARA
mgnify:CR=1 FL=1